jgi:hypothetical protein
MLDIVVYVQTYDNSLRLAKYIKANIQSINASGKKINMVLVPSDTRSQIHTQLKDLGIQKLPALVAKNVKKIGYDSIVAYLSQNDRAAGGRSGGYAIPPPNDVESFYQRELEMAHKDTKKEETGFADGDVDDMMRRAATFTKRRKEENMTPRPSHNENIARARPIADAPEGAPAPQTGFTRDDEEGILRAYMDDEIGTGGSG